MAEIRNAEDLEEWLKWAPIRLKVAVASRCALRLSLSIGFVVGEQKEKNRDWRNNVVLPMFDLLIYSATTSSHGLIGIDKDIFFRFMLRSEKLVSLEHARHSVDPNFVDAYLSFNSIEKLSRLSRWVAKIDDNRAIIEAFESPPVIFFPTIQDVKILRSAISNDVDAIERGVDLRSQPLWFDDTPEWAVRGWETLATELTKRAPYWKTLVRWYEDRLHGDDWAASQGRPAIPELEIARASLPDSYWKKGGKAVNEAIAKLEDYFWNGVPINDPVLRELVDCLGEPPAGESFEVVDEEGIEATSPVPIEPPTLPPQIHGPHFGLRDGLLDFAPPEHLDASKNNIQRLTSLIPLLRAEVAAAIEIFGRNKAHGRIHDALASYSSLLEGDVTALNYDLLAGFGVKLQAEEAAAKEAIADGLEPAFERSETAVLKSVLDLHGPVILSTEAGQTFVADAERWIRNPRQEKQFRQSATKLAEAIEADGIATPSTARFVKDAAADVGLGPQPERSAVFGVGTIRNVSIALIAGAAVYVGANAVMSMDMTHWLYILLLNEGIKHSDVGKGTSGLISNAINDVTRGKALKKIYKFVLAHEAVIRRIAGKRREFSFLNDWLDWLKANPPTD